VPVLEKRLAAPEWVFNLGMGLPVRLEELFDASTSLHQDWAFCVVLWAGSGYTPPPPKKT
jgi:hypothetical protein